MNRVRLLTFVLTVAFALVAAMASVAGAKPQAGPAGGGGGRRHEGRARLCELRSRREARLPVQPARAVHAPAEEG